LNSFSDRKLNTTQGLSSVRRQLSSLDSLDFEIRKPAFLVLVLALESQDLFFKEPVRKLTAQSPSSSNYLNSLLSLQKHSFAGHWWLTPVILATLEAVIRRITVQSQPRENRS
jgi:hypothetical protein